MSTGEDLSPVQQRVSQIKCYLREVKGLGVQKERRTWGSWKRDREMLMDKEV